MRVAPVALYAMGDLPHVAAIARQTARITHSHELGVEGTVLQACAVAHLLESVAEFRYRENKWRGQDSNLRPRGYEPRELPDCSTPRHFVSTGG